ncbi:MAG: hypothetical protein IT371_00135 [Deltaproteobacteria bacterium]|nr:hypothetical protein [Deltaproteobacteria bacterium]
MRAALAVILCFSSAGCAEADFDRAKDCTLEKICRPWEPGWYGCGAGIGLDPEQRCCGAVGHIVAKACDAAGRCYMFGSTCVPYGFQYPWPDARVPDGQPAPDSRADAWRWDANPTRPRDAARDTR